MGKDYSDNVYKKSYTDDYVKSYAKSFDQQSKYNEFVAEYNTVSKKIGTRTYSKVEKEVYKGIQPTVVDTANAVRAEGRQRPIRKKPTIPATPPPATVKEQSKAATSNIDNTQQKQVEETPPAYTWPVNNNTAKQQKQAEGNPPLYVPPTNTNKATKKMTAEYVSKTTKKSEPYSYIEPNSVNNPITRLPDGSFYNIYTKEEIDNEEARRILDYDGYEPKDTPSLKTILLVCLFTIPFKVISPIVIIGFGLWLMVKPTTVMQKTKQFLVLRISVGATDSEKLENKNKGIICIVAGIVIGIIQIIIYT